MNSGSCSLPMVVVLPPAGPSAHSIEILGLTIHDRISKSAVKNGFGDVLFLNESAPAIPSIPEEICIQNFGIIFKHSAWSRVRELPIEDESVVFFDGIDDFFLVRSKNKAMVRRVLESSGSITMIADQFKRELRTDCRIFASGSWISYRKASDLKATEDWLLQGLIKNNEGFMSKRLERKISLAVSRRLVPLNVSPNQMTIFSVVVGLVGSLFFISSQKWYHVAGSLLFWLHSVLDGCDGEIARLKYLESRIGGLLDFWGDNLVHSAVFSMIALGLYLRSDKTSSLLFGSLAVGGTILSAGWVYKTMLKHEKTSGPVFTSVVQVKNKTDRLADFLARRDFIYLVLILAAIGKIEWFLWLGAFGAPIYFIFVFISSIRRVC